jgi:hypothetical protein
MKYILILFVANENQKKFIENVCAYIEEFCDSDIKYNYGNEVIILTFDSKRSIQEINKSLIETKIFKVISYVLIPHNTENNIIHLDDFATEHLLDNESQESQNNFTNQQLDIGMIYEAHVGMILEELHNSFEEQVNCEPPTLDDLLDKINEKGIKSLNKNEVKLLEKYSKNER